MGIVYPNGIDSFSVPSNPQATSLSSGGSSTRDHPQSHEDLGNAIIALEMNASPLTHDHSGRAAGVVVTEATPGQVAANDVQTITITGTPTGGTFTLTLGANTTSAIAFNATAATVQTALQALASVGSGNATVTGGGGPYFVTFVGSLAHSPVAALTATSSLTGGVPVITIIHNTVGTAGRAEVQTITVTGTPTGGTFTLTFGGYITGPLLYNALASDVQAALQALTSIGSGNVAVTSTDAVYTVTFQGALAASPQALIVATASLIGGLFTTNKLIQANTHQNPDTDTAITALHHTIGQGPAQAAAGNHAHDYEGPAIFNKPMVICTSTTRPIDPQIGMIVFEQDTNSARIWSEFPGNTLGAGINYTYHFNSANSPSSLDPTLFTQIVVQGSVPADGTMGAPTANDCVWQRGRNRTCQIIYQASGADIAVTDTDDQVLTFTTGNDIIDQHEGDLPSPTNDAFLRMSPDGQSYVRFSVQDQGVGIFFSSSGEVAEQGLGGVKTPYTTPKTKWVAKAIGSTYVLYQDGQQVLAVVDYNNLVRVGPTFRGWGIGMMAAKGSVSQLLPNNVTSVTIQDVPYHVEALDWQLLNWASVPHIRVEARFRQRVVTGPKGNAIGYDTVINDWVIDPFTNLDIDGSAFTITEAGHYHCHISVPWDPSYDDFDQSGVGVAVNGQDIGRKSVSFMRGNGYSPGFPQTSELFFTYYFAKGDLVRVFVQHNADLDQWLYHNNVPPHVFSSWAEFDFMGP